MPFQSTVFINQGAGVPGEQYSDGPWRAQQYTIVSSNAANNIIGSTMCCVTSATSFNFSGCAAGNDGGAGNLPFAGLLVDPKNIALFGTGGQPLSPTLTVPNQTQVECATMGSYWVKLPAAANIGDWVIYDSTTGAISTVPPNTTLPAGKSWGNAIVDYFNIDAAGLAVITLNPGVGQPTN